MNDIIKGRIFSGGTLRGKLDNNAEVNGYIDHAKTKPLPWYEGDYELTPVWENVTIETKQKSMQEDVTMQAIPYAEVDNLAGGKTVIIGG